jgi:hypothetical protein
MSQLVDRMLRAAKLEAQLYEEVEADPAALGQAMLVVVISSVGAGLGSLFAGGFSGLLGGTVMALLGWFVWSFVVFVIGTRFLPEPQTQADYGQLLRTIGFSAAPGVLRVFGFLGLLGQLINFLVGLWMLAAMVIAVRQALDYTGTGRAVAVCLLGFIAYLLVFLLLGSLLVAGSRLF